MGKGAVPERCIIDKQAEVGLGAQIGWRDDLSHDRDEPENLNTAGIIIVGEWFRVTAGTRIGRNCRMMSWTREGTFSSNTVPGGSTVDKPIAPSDNLTCPA